MENPQGGEEVLHDLHIVRAVYPQKRPQNPALRQRPRYGFGLYRSQFLGYVQDFDRRMAGRLEGVAAGSAIRLDEDNLTTAREAGGVVIAVAPRLGVPVGHREHHHGIEWHRKTGGDQVHVGAGAAKWETSARILSVCE